MPTSGTARYQNGEQATRFILAGLNQVVYYFFSETKVEAEYSK
jgi:hypothetical protein